MRAWLRQHLVADVYACLEATNTYHDALARSLLAQGHTVSVVNPAAGYPLVGGAFARAELARGKTDKADAARIARYCRAHQPRPREPPAEAVSILQALVRRREALGQMVQVEAQRLEESPQAVHASITAVLAVLNEQAAAVEEQIRDHRDTPPDLKAQSELLQSIPGIGATTAANLLCELGDVSRFSGARQVAAFVGLAPRLRQSGTSVRSRAVLCNTHEWVSRNS